MRISDWSSDVCSSDLLPRCSISSNADAYERGIGADPQAGPATPSGRRLVSRDLAGRVARWRTRHGDRDIVSAGRGAEIPLAQAGRDRTLDFPSRNLSSPE